MHAPYNVILISPCLLVFTKLHSRFLFYICRFQVNKPLADYRPQFTDLSFNQLLIITSYKSLSTVNIYNNNKLTLQPQPWTEKKEKG